MRLTKPLLQLPITFCADTLEAEVRALPKSAWVPHPSGFPGNDAVRLITPEGEATDAIRGTMAPTEHLSKCPYVMEVMAELDGVWGRSRLMGLGAGAEVRSHVDTDYYWRTHLRIHIPVITNPGVQFTCGNETVHMKAAECWVFDSFQWHEVHNNGSEHRVHLVLDTVGGERLWDLIDASQSGTTSQSPRKLLAGERPGGPLAFEQVNAPKVMTPWEIQCHIAYVAERALPHPMLDTVMKRLDKFQLAWAAAWAHFGPADEGLPTYRQLIANLHRERDDLSRHEVMLRNELKLYPVFEQLVLANALEDPRASDPFARPVVSRVRSPRASDASLVGAKPSNGGQVSVAALAADSAAARPVSSVNRFDRPIFIVSTPRSGSTLLFEALSQAPNLFTIGSESHHVIESVPGLSPGAHGWTSNRLTADDATPDRLETLAGGFHELLRDRDGRRPDKHHRMLEKTPKNALRVPFFNAAFPDATFIYLYRDVRETLASMIEAWLSGAFRTYPQLPGWQGPPWSLLLTPDWARLNGLPLPQIVAHQWSATTELLVGDLANLPRQRVRGVIYSELLSEPQATMERLTVSLDLAWDRPLGSRLPLSKTTVSKPEPDKWRRIASVIEEVWPIVEEANAKALTFADSLRS